MFSQRKASEKPAKSQRKASEKVNKRDRKYRATMINIELDIFLILQGICLDI